MAESFYLFLMFLPLLAPVTAAAAIGLVVHSIVVRVRGRQERARVVWAKLAIIGICVALATYGAGLFSGGLLYLADPEDLCMIAGPGHSYSSAPSHLLPLRNPICVYEGQRVDLVPAFVNPVFFISISLFITGVVGVVASRRSRSQATRHSPAA
ncbi:hypothetical protein IMZ11_12390 [Microtetraspora sp. AC03309]|uniref:hypothetical protein n=1 Tax=Microtetraspora sp. AC03309 TaxID=2779376 RepID=UPI001E59B82C|nr:hypothetical protein [Microtetraspora sp. AC03309]MCC5576432.1 hypothetical protein [Microtetraspora sp. AC03309]